MSESHVSSIEQLVRSVGRYPEEAFYFVREGLNHTVEKIHGEETQAHQALGRFLSKHNMDWSDLIEQYHSGELSEVMIDAIEAAGGCENLNRHVGGRELCWGLREFALQRWGFMARTVLDYWRISGTEDFGKIVFAFIDHGLMQKQEGDELEDFVDVYSFDEVFDDSFRIGKSLDGPVPPQGSGDD